MTDEVQLETELVAWIAGILGLAVDSGVYRGGFLPGVRTGIAVLLHDEIKDSTVKPQTFNVQILGKFAGDNARDEALRMRAKLSAAVPCYGVETNGFTFPAILPRGGGDPYLAEDGDEIKTFMSVNLLASALTKQSS